MRFDDGLPGSFVDVKYARLIPEHEEQGDTSTPDNTRHNLVPTVSVDNGDDDEDVLHREVEGSGDGGATVGAVAGTQADTDSDDKDTDSDEKDNVPLKVNYKEITEQPGKLKDWPDIE